jgi:flavin reductase (DIM6/NTAB) family NADH-FMN oxidoreductase RutF/rubredoxin
MDKKALYKLSYGLFLLSAKSKDKINGCIINTAIQVTNEPVRLSVTVSKNNYTSEMILRSDRVCLSVLSMDVTMDTIARFGFQSGKDVKKFDDFEYFNDNYGLPYIKKGVNAVFSGKVISNYDIGSHITFIIEIDDSTVLSDAPSITYDYYQKVKKGTTFVNAPSFNKESSENISLKKKAWKCKICGYIEYADELPENFNCPICEHPKEDFELIYVDIDEYNKMKVK